ncbi:MAG: rhomboid family intramembrane serine protease [Rubripirellula sp.]
MRNDIYGIGILVLVLWLVFIVDALIPAQLVGWGLHPRTLTGLIGVVSMPLLHGSLGHIVSNTVPLIVLLVLLSGSKANNWTIVLAVVLLNGALLWLFGRNAIHVGASGLVFGLIAFLIVSGAIEKRPIPLAIAVLVGLLFGGTLITGVLPRMGGQVSWDGHLTGAIAGGTVAYALTSFRSASRAF